MEQEKVCTVRELIGNIDERYFIPIYQRNYAWDFSEVYLLIEDVADYAKKENRTPYYIGNLIVLPDSTNQNLFETIDGQQRLTTLYILVCALSNNKFFSNQYDFAWFNRQSLAFRNRAKSTNALAKISGDSSINNTDCDGHIISVYNAVAEKTKAICKDRNLLITRFLDYLFDSVKILRVCLPHDVDKNHYFEIMNSRGVQLEQYEIVKAHMLEPLKDSQDEMAIFNDIWKACSNMEKYLQMNFEPENRKHIFGNDWTNDPIQNFEQICQGYKLDSKDDNNKPPTLSELIDNFSPNCTKKSPETKDNGDEQFYSVINFQNFLLHTLKILLCLDKYKGLNIKVTLDDKVLSETFDNVLNAQKDKRTFVIDYITCLLRCRFLFDKYIVRHHQYSKTPDRWVLLRINSRIEGNTRQPYYVNTFGKEDSSEGDEAIMLLSMFHVSVPAMIYKNWLYACLKFAFLSNDMTVENYTKFLRNLAKSYMLDRYLASEQSKFDLSEIADRYNGEELISPVNHFEHGSLPIALNCGTSVEVFCFNYYDYLLWKKDQTSFSFTHRTSVEHFFPQHPEGRKAMDKEFLDSFGNLCLITSSQNSKFTNLLPAAKYKQYKDQSVTNQSLKLKSMFDAIAKGAEWNEDTISDAQKEAFKLIENNLKA